MPTEENFSIELLINASDSWTLYALYHSEFWSPPAKRIFFVRLSFVCLVWREGMTDPDSIIWWIYAVGHFSLQFPDKQKLQEIKFFPFTLEKIPFSSLRSFLFEFSLFLDSPVRISHTCSRLLSRRIQGKKTREKLSKRNNCLALNTKIHEIIYWLYGQKKIRIV